MQCKLSPVKEKDTNINRNPTEKKHTTTKKKNNYIVCLEKKYKNKITEFINKNCGWQQTKYKITN